MGKRSLIVCARGYLLLDDEWKLVDSYLFGDIEEAKREIWGIEEEGGTEKLLRFLEGYDGVVVQDIEIKKYLEKKGLEATVDENLVREFVRRRRKYLENLRVSREEDRRYCREVSLFITGRKIARESSKLENQIIQAVGLVDEMDKAINVFGERLREWYGLHFPELWDLIRKYERYVKLIITLERRNRFTVERLMKLGYDEEKARQIAEAAQSSIGAEDMEIQVVLKLAHLTAYLIDERRRMVEFIDRAMMKVAPNLREVAGPMIGARLLAHVGGLENLAKMPSSTIQVLGAEKALFRSLRRGTKPPKHGIIFQSSLVHGKPRHLRGKAARILAGKIAIAARVDAFSGEFIADKLIKEVEEKIGEEDR
ncbi:C/D box methylation guide ribonucleoprotein complex aNOP56 subunit [Candidatus Bathyarchaeota archaeon ex4484_205]|nr:MAG: C/D box methylation guide ribonucleoprotein complex aNOP56 subunit [Candidatus Bathyarchaeota archaeon ex4484_205]RLG68732.1 MAG: C/D box methylation guide ribonucleoprotein complex aNOP56 subunit [archaeon]